MNEPQSIATINRILRQYTSDWLVEEACATASGDAFLRLYRQGEAVDELVFVTALPRDTGAGTICAFVGACKHYYQLGQGRAAVGGPSSKTRGRTSKVAPNTTVIPQVSQ